MSLVTKKVSALTVAEYFIDKANKDKKGITNKKLQKLVYYAQAWFLVFNNQKLFNEKIEAWVHGPAIKSLYVKYKDFGFNYIQKEADATLIKTIPTEAKKLLDEIWSVYGGLDADYLEMLTHNETPWKEAREGLESSKNSENEISPKTMKSFYSQKLEIAKK
ncbi:MAG: type II toxin-antitoxin system antitoxin SocA domain-containing protein [Candidatus Paceibacterota bacterium]|jgi:uncharacterized phage-associated protein